MSGPAVADAAAPAAPPTSSAEPARRSRGRRVRPPIEALERALGHHFADRHLLERALTHVSAIAPGTSTAQARTSSYQRLEFLGDRVLGLTVAAMLYRAFPDDEEGALSRRLAALVRKETCAAIAEAWGVGPHLRLGGGETGQGARKRATLLGDVAEALVGAVYLDGGEAAVRAVVEPVWEPRMREPDAPPSDAKTALQEWAQGRGLGTPAYRLVERQGPDHNPRFLVAVEVEGQGAGEGQGRSKRLAEQAAAGAMLARVATDEPAGEASYG